MSDYTQNQLLKRDKIIQSHAYLGNFLNASSLNTLVHLFDDENDKNISTVGEYITNERHMRNMDTLNTTIKGEVYGETVKNSTLYLGIKKNNIEFLHLTIHLSPNSLNANHHGMLHFSKDIYLELLSKKLNVSKNSIKRKLSKYIYTIISVRNPDTKPNSLEFFIEDEQLVPPGLQNVNRYQYELEQEMHIILTVLNRMFDETNTEYYIGAQKPILNIHTKTNTILKNMNTRTKYFTRKNWGITLLPTISNQPPIQIKRKRGEKTRKLYKKPNILNPKRKNIYKN